MNVLPRTKYLSAFKGNSVGNTFIRGEKQQQNKTKKTKKTTKKPHPTQWVINRVRSQNHCSRDLRTGYAPQLHDVRDVGALKPGVEPCRCPSVLAGVAEIDISCVALFISLPCTREVNTYKRESSRRSDNTFTASLMKMHVVQKRRQTDRQIHIYIHTYVHTYINTYIHVCLHIHTYTYILTYT